MKSKKAISRWGEGAFGLGSLKTDIGLMFRMVDGLNLLQLIGMRISS